jgi:hypothetical protein
MENMKEYTKNLNLEILPLELKKKDCVFMKSNPGSKEIFI